MELVCIKDIGLLLTYVTDRNAQAAATLNEMVLKRIGELMGEGVDFPPIGVMLTNNTSVLIGYDPTVPVTEDILFFTIVDIDENNVSTGVNTFYVINLIDGTVIDSTAGLATVH